MDERLDTKAAEFEAIVTTLGKPFARGDRFAIYRGDSSDLLKCLPDNCINLAWTSPPYNIGKEYEHILPLDSYLNWCEAWINELYRASAAEGAFVLNVGYLSIPGRAKSIPIPYLLWNRIPFFLQQEIVWNYGAGVASKNYLSPRNEKLLWYVKDSGNYTFNLDEIRDPDVAYPNQKKNGKLRCNQLGKNPSDVWRIAKVTSGKGRASVERTKHPAQFPIDMCERVLRGFSHHHDIVVDPFVGSGSTIESCLKFERFSIGIEVREDYCSIASQRARSVLK